MINRLDKIENELNNINDILADSTIEDESKEAYKTIEAIIIGNFVLSCGYTELQYQTHFLKI